MKRAKILLSLLLGALMAFAVMAFAACEPEEELPGDDPVLEFVAADKTNWDKEVTLGEKKFTMALTLNADKTLVLSATCTGKAETGGGQGGSGFPDFGDSASLIASAAAESDGEEDTTDYAAFSFTVGGSWSEEAGWGYTLKFSDGANTEIVADYDTTMGRHYFYYYMSPTIGGAAVTETQVQFQAKDADYRKKLNASYVINEERIATYMFRGGGFDSMTGNKAEARFFLLPAGSVVSYIESGSTLTYDAKGSWTEDKTTKTVSATVGGKTYTTDAYCSAAGREGYRMPYSSYALYCAVADGMTWDQYNSADFEGATILTLTGEDYTLALTEKGYANIVKDGAVALSTTYTKDANGNYAVTTKYGTYTSVKEGDTLTFEIHIPVSSGFGPWATEVETTIVFTGPAA